MKNVKQNIRKIGQAGFSLVEMLVVIAVIGVIAAIAIPNIGNINTSAREATAQRNAQSIVSVYSAGLAAGCTPASSKADALTKIASGTWMPSNGVFKDKVFVVPNLPASGSDTYTMMEAKLDWDGTNKYLNYNQAGAPAP